jgi:hypothetical protein
MTGNDEKAVLPCPFCGGEPKVRIPQATDGYAVHMRCRCGVEVYGGKRHFASGDDAIAAWNTRATTQAVRDADGEAVAVAQVRRPGKRAPHDALYVGLIPRGPRTPEVKEGDLLYLAPPAAIATEVATPSGVPVGKLRELAAAMESSWRANCCCSETAKACADELEQLAREHEDGQG